jgi:tetratricopeptide (TPR) repeat protein
VKESKKSTDVQQKADQPQVYDIILNRIKQLIERDQINAAALLIPSLRRYGVDAGVIIVLEAMIEFRQGNHDRAKQIVADALIEHPANPLLLRMSSEISLGEHNWVEAAKAAAEAVVLDPNDATAKSMLGRALIELGYSEDGNTCLREALAEMPDNLQVLGALARNAPGEAEAAIKAALTRLGSGFGVDHAEKLKLSNILISILLERGAFVDASACIGELVADGIADLDTCLLAVHAAGSTGKWDEATALFNSTTRSLRHHA